jgi:hypothetical protein
VQNLEILWCVKISSKCHFIPVDCHKRSWLKYSFLHMLTINTLYHDDCYQWSVVHRYARWLERQITFGWINYKVIGIRAKYILVHGTENEMPYWEVQNCLPYCCEKLVRFKAILLRGIAQVVLLHCDPCSIEHLFYNMASVPLATKPGSRKPWFRTRVCVRRCNRTGRLNNTREW